MSDIFDKISFLESRTFVDDLKNELSSKPSRIKIINFKINYQDIFIELAPLLINAAKRGARVELEVDGIFSKHNLAGSSHYIPLWGKGKEEQEYQSNQIEKIYSQLKKYGGSVKYLNPPSFFNKYFLPFSGRDHRKVVLIEIDSRKIVYFGATNFEEADRNDYMLKIVDSELFDKLDKIHSLEYIHEATNDFVLKINESLEFILDIGKSFKSMIQSRAYELIKSAKNKIVFVSQLPPEPGLMFEFIKSRLNGVKVQIITPEFKHKQVTGFPYIFAFIFDLLLSKIFDIKITGSIKGFVHAKILISDETLLLGSHNLSNIGVWAGTREFSAIIKNRRLWGDVQDFVNDLIYDKHKQYRLNFAKKYEKNKNNKE